MCVFMQLCWRLVQWNILFIMLESAVLDGWVRSSTWISAAFFDKRRRPASIQTKWSSRWRPFGICPQSVAEKIQPDTGFRCACPLLTNTGVFGRWRIEQEAHQFGGGAGETLCCFLLENRGKLPLHVARLRSKSPSTLHCITLKAILCAWSFKDRFYFILKMKVFCFNLQSNGSGWTSFPVLLKRTLFWL